MMAGNPNWWSMNMNGGMHPHDYQLQFPPTSSNPSLISDHRHHHPGYDFPVRSWSQLLLGGGEDDRYGANLFQQQKKLENWEDQVLLNLNPCNNFAARVSPADNVKQEIAPRPSSYRDDEFQAVRSSASSSSNCWPAAMPAVISSPTSCITNNILNFSSSGNKSATKPHHHDHSSERNSSCTTTAGGVTKKARVQQSSAQPALKVRKEKLGDRITALHQLVSPFGKTDTASVLSEAIGYIRFLQGQIEALSSPYMRNATTGHHQHSFLNDVGIERGAPKQDSSEGQSSDLRSRGLCLVPVSFTQHMANDTAAGGADYWAPAALGGGF